MRNPQAGVESAVGVCVTSGIHKRFLLRCFLSVLVALLRIVPLTVKERNMCDAHACLPAAHTHCDYI